MILLLEWYTESNDSDDLKNILNINTNTSLNRKEKIIELSHYASQHARCIHDWSIWFYHWTQTQEFVWNRSHFYQNQRCCWGWAKAPWEKVLLHREINYMFPTELDINLKITRLVHFKSLLIFNITLTGSCCTSYAAWLRSTIAPVLNLQENSYPHTKEKILSTEPEAALRSIKPPSMHSHCKLKLKLISPARPVFFFLFCH